jgi:hypothetical protein
MIDRKVAKVKIRAGEYSQLKNKVFDSGELLYTTDNNGLYVGDGVSQGGVGVSNKNFIVKTSKLTVPKQAAYGDIIFNPVLGRTYILDRDNSNNLVPLLILDSNCSFNSKLEIEKMKNELRSLSGCLNYKKEITDNLLLWDKQPKDITNAKTGSLIKLTAIAVGPNDITYQWKKFDDNGVYHNIKNANKSTYIIKSFSQFDYGRYFCTAHSNKLGVSIDSDIVILSNDFSIKSISESIFETNILFNNGDVYTWGEHYIPYNRYNPVKIQGIPPIVKIITSGSSTIGMSNDGSLYGWGSNYSFVLSSSNKVNYFYKPIKLNVAPVKDFDFVTSRIIVLGVNNKLSGWGLYNTFPNQTLTPVPFYSSPVEINIPPVSKFKISSTNCYFLGVDGNLSSSGNFYGLGAKNVIIEDYAMGYMTKLFKVDVTNVKDFQPCLGGLYIIGNNDKLSAFGYGPSILDRNSLNSSINKPNVVFNNIIRPFNFIDKISKISANNTSYDYLNAYEDESVIFLDQSGKLYTSGSFFSYNDPCSNINDLKEITNIYTNKYVTFVSDKNNNLFAWNKTPSSLNSIHQVMTQGYKSNAEKIYFDKFDTRTLCLFHFNDGLKDEVNLNRNFKNDGTPTTIKGPVGYLGNSCLYLDGKSAIFSDIVKWYGDFCIEFRFFLNTIKTINAFLDFDGSNNQIYCTPNTINFFGFVVNFNVNVNTWYHLAISRQSNSIRIFIDGKLIKQFDNSYVVAANNNIFTIGLVQGNRYLNGYMDELIIVAGDPIYTTDFTVKTTETNII